MPTISDLDEDARLEALYALGVLDTAPEETYERIVRLARKLLKVPVAKINLIDRDRQWTKASSGSPRVEVERRNSFCTWTIQQDEPLVVRDARDEPRFSGCPPVEGERAYRFYVGVPLTDRAGHNLGALCCLDYEPRFPSDAQVANLQDLAALTVEIMEMRQVATTDCLTGVMTRRAFLESARRDVDLALRHGRQLCALMVDIDHFKAINDTYGHPAGDHVLSRTATLLMQRLRTSDYIGRLGGEEFGVLLHETSPSYAFEVAERLRSAVADHVCFFEGARLRVTASFGLAGLEGPTSDLPTLLQRADASLYAAKAGGRNRTVNFELERVSCPA